MLVGAAMVYERARMRGARLVQETAEDVDSNATAGLTKRMLDDDRRHAILTLLAHITTMIH